MSKQLSSRNSRQSFVLNRNKLSYYTQSIIYLISFFIPMLFGIMRFKQLDNGLQLIVYLLIVSFIIEVIAFFFAILYKNNLVIYNFELLINTILLFNYFKFNIEQLKNTFHSILITASIFTFWLFTILFICKIDSINTTFIIFQGVFVMGLSILLLDKLSSQKRRVVYKLSQSPNFWIATILLFYWCLTFMQWSLYRTFTKEAISTEYIDTSLTIITILLNLGYAYILFRYPKLKYR